MIRTTVQAVMTFPDSETCRVCDELVVCQICEACPDHCKTPGGPDACWQTFDNYRRMLAPNYPPPPKA
jgi:hypothetical protein